MSAAAFPRVYLTGHFYWNPSTYNNDDYSSGYPNPLVPYCATEGRPTWKTFLAKHNVTRENFKKWSLELFNLDPTTQDDLLAPPEWNYFGGNQSGFVTPDEPWLEQPEHFSRPTGDKQVTLVRGYTDTRGSYHDSGDAWINQTIQFNANQSPAKLVDVNPTVPWSSQIFADRFTLGDDQNGFSAPVAARMHSRWVGPHNYNTDGGLMIAGFFSCVFQTCFEKDAIDWHGSSALCTELQQAMGNAGTAGLMLRFCAYDTVYFSGDYFNFPPSEGQFPGMKLIRELYLQYYADLETYECGERKDKPQPPCNRAYSRIVGWIAPWYEGELVNMPDGRALLPSICPGQNDAALPTPQPINPKGFTGDAQTANPFPFNPASVQRNADFTLVTVDMSSAIPEIDSTGKIADVGPVELAIMLSEPSNPNAAAKRVTLATIADEAAIADGTYAADYQKYAGLVDLNPARFKMPITVDQFDNNPLVITAVNHPPNAAAATAVALTENPLNAQTNIRGVYVNESRPGDTSPTTSFRIKVAQFGRLPGEQVGLVVVQFDRAWSKPVVGDGFVQLFYQTPDGSYVPIDNQTMVDASNGEVTIGVRAIQPGLPNLLFFPVAGGRAGLSPISPMPVPATLDVDSPPSWTAAFYAVGRVLPFDIQHAVSFETWLNTNPDVESVNERVYAEIFETYFLMYPVMDFIDSPQRFQEWRGRILAVTDPALFESAAYMPVMRAMSAGDRRIIELYNLYLNGVPQSPLRHRREGQRAMR